MLSALIAALTPAAMAADAAEAAAGERVFRSQCMGCHSVEAGRNRAGPTLHGLIDRPSGAVDGFDYSQAMLDADLVWDRATLDAFLADPGAVVPGTKMVFWGLPEDERRRVIAYLETAGD